MRYVLDSSVAFKWEVQEAGSAKAVRLRDAARSGLHELIAPDVFTAEQAHAMTRAERQGASPGRTAGACCWASWRTPQ